MDAIQKIYRLVTFLGIGFAMTGQALQTQYVRFEHPNRWECELSQGVWICQDTKEPDRRESIVLSIAAVASEWDNLRNYEDFLKKRRTITTEAGKQLTSEVKYTRIRDINGTKWVDSLQRNSEIPGFWTRYLATVQRLGKTGKTNLAILVTYVVSEKNYKKLAPQFERMITSLKPNADFNLNVASKQRESPLASQIVGGNPTNIGPILRDRLNTDPRQVEAPAPPDYSIAILLLTLGLAAGYLFIRKRSRS